MRHSRLLPVLLALLVIAGCGGGGPDPAAAGPVAGTQVRVDDNVFEPLHLQVEAGATVTWTWVGSTAHDVSGEGFASELQREGTFTHTFREAGEYAYACTVHRGMRGQVTVR